LLRSNRRTTVATFAVASAATLAISVATPVAAKTVARPPTPTSVSVTSNSSGLSLTWHHKNNVTGYLVEQAQNSHFTVNLVKYKTRGIQKAFTPSKVSRGTTYFFRVAALNGTRRSHFSRTVIATDRVSFSTIRALSYNVRSAKFDGQQAPGGTVAPFEKRLPGQLYLLRAAKADVIGIEEGAYCMVKNHAAPCTRQIDQIHAGLSGYALSDTATDVDPATGRRGVVNRYAADDILYKTATLAPVGPGGHYDIGPSGSLDRTCAFQIFKVKSTGAKFLFVVTHTLASGSDQVRGTETANGLKGGRAIAKANGIKSILFTGDYNSYVGEYHVHDYSGTVMRNANVPDSIGEALHYSNAKYDSINAYFRTPKQGHGSSDHIYATRGIGVLKWGELLHLSGGKFVGTIPSDHNPIYADVELPY
jgi:hypothetical protein